MLIWFGHTIPTLVLSVLFTITGVILLIMAFRVKGKGNKSLVMSEDNLKIGAKAIEIHTFGYYGSIEVAQMQGEKIPYLGKGDKLIFIDVILAPLKPMALSMLALELGGKKFDVTEIPVSTIKDTCTYKVKFNISKDCAVDTKEARIYALAGNSEWFSEPFQIGEDGEVYESHNLR